MEIKMDNFLKMVNLVRVGGSIEDGIFEFKKSSCIVNAIDQDANILLRVEQDLGLPAWGSLCLTNLKYFMDLLSITKGRTVDISYDEDNNHLVVKDQKLKEATNNEAEIRYQLSQVEAIRCKVEKEGVMDEILGQLVGTIKLDKNVYSYVLDRLKVCLSASIIFDIKKSGEVFLSIGQQTALETLVAVPIGMTKPFSKKDVSIPIAKAKLIGVMEVLEFEEEKVEEVKEEKPKLKKKEKAPVSNPTMSFVLDKEQNLIVFQQAANTWIVSEVMG